MKDSRTIRARALDAARPGLANPVLASKALIFLAAGLSFAGSIYLWFSGLREEGLFVGLWVPSILSAGAMLMVGGSAAMTDLGLFIFGTAVTLIAVTGAWLFVYARYFRPAYVEDNSGQDTAAAPADF